MYYKSQLNYEYPSRSDEHMITVKRIRKTNFDVNYSYIDRRFRFKLLRVMYWLLVTFIVFPLLRLTHGLRIYGKKNLKKHKKALENGAITIANHVFYWDFLCVLKAIRPRLTFFPAWKDNFEGPNGGLIRLSGGIPIPTDSVRAMMKFNSAMEELMKSKRWIHFFPEGSMWLYYPDIRPFKKAVFNYAVKFERPVVPIALSFRPRRGLTKLFTKKPCVDLHIGEPIFMNKELSKKEAAEQMQREAYHVIQVMAGINPGDPTYNTNQNIAAYQKTM